jgi:flagellar hook-associated protein 2
VSDVSLATGATTYRSGSIKWSGLGSGVDFTDVVEQLVELERTNINRLEIWRKEWVAKIESIEGLNDRLIALEANAADLDSYSEFYTRAASSSHESVVSVTNTSLAEVGSHTIEVAENIPGKIISASILDGAGVGADGDIVLQIGDDTLTVAVLATDTIDDVAAKILAADTGGLLENVQVIDDKTRANGVIGGPGDYKRLVMVAAEGGSENEFTVTSDPTDLSMDEASFDQAFYSPNDGWLSDLDIERQGTYTGNTNKTITFMVVNTGTVGEDDITIRWADDENNSGTFVVDSLDSDWSTVIQGMEIRFASTGGNNRVYANDTFTVDCFAPTLQAAQDQGLAQSDKRVHEGFIDLITPITDGDTATFTYQYAGVEYKVNVPGNAKLEDLVNAINNDEDNKNVTASIINDGLGTSTSYHLVLSGKETGAEHTIKIIDSTLTDFNADDSSFETTQKASNAMVRLDGYPSDDSSYIQRSINTISDVIEGVILNIQDSGTSTVTVSNDTEEIEHKIEQFVSSLNFVLDYIRQETAYQATTTVTGSKINTETETKGAMLGNYSYDIVRSSINSILSSAIPGLESGVDAYTHLANIGIESDPNQNGKWVVDSTVLTKAIQTDLESVARMFVSENDHNGQTVTGIAEQIRSKMEEYTDTDSGIGYVLIKNYSGIISQINNKITNEERRIAMVRSRLEEKFARLESSMNKLDGQASYIKSQLDKLPKVGK